MESLIFYYCIFAQKETADINQLLANSFFKVNSPPAHGLVLSSLSKNV